MALILIEEFRRYAAVADVGTDNDDLTTQWSIDGGIALSASGGRFGEQALQVQATGRQELIRLGSGAVSGSTLIVGFALKWSGSQSGNVVSRTNLLICRTSAASNHWTVQIGNGGTIYILNSSDTIVQAYPMAIQSDCWHYIEIKVSMLDSGSFNLKVDGELVVNALSGDFRSGTGNTSNIEQLSFRGNEDNTYISDIIVMDGSGATFNDYKGDMRYECAVPDADGGTLQWTASAGSNFQCIDDALGAYNDDTDYISEATTDDINLASHGTISATNATTIHFAALFALARSDTTGDKIALVAKSGAATGTGPDIALAGTTSTAYRWKKGYFETDPNTSSAWTVANINAAEWGCKKRV